MRIIAGTWRGRTLVAPKGDATRPTADRTREALFSMLTSRVGSFGLDDDISRQYYEAVQEFVRVRGRISEATLEFLRRAVLELKLLDPDYWTFIISAYRSPADQRTVARWVEEARPFPGGDWRLIARVLRAAAPLSEVGRGQVHQAAGVA